jgi:hypothetical protein
MVLATVKSLKGVSMILRFALLAGLFISGGSQASEDMFKKEQTLMDLQLHKAVSDSSRHQQITRFHEAGSFQSQMAPLAPMAPMGSPDSGSFYDYQTDDCVEKALHVTNESDLRKDGLRRCKDGTVSFVQPSSEGFRGMEGKCGQTAAANLMYMYCKLITSPKRYTDHYLSDITPGVRPGTLREGLEDMFDKNWEECPQEKGDWHWFGYDYESDYIDGIKRGLQVRYSTPNMILRTRANGSKVYRAPLALLIRPPGGKDLHWIVVVDVINKVVSKKNVCHMVVNHWDDQFEVPCSKIGRWSRGVEDSYGMILDKYSVIKFK